MDKQPRTNNVQGRKTVAMNITIPKELNQKINGIAVNTNKSRSLVISELIKKGLQDNG